MASVKRLKEDGSRSLGVHPVLRTAGVTAADDTRAQLLDAVRSYKASRVSWGNQPGGGLRKGFDTLRTMFFVLWKLLALLGMGRL